MILADADVFSVKHGNLWLDNLYLRATSGSDIKGARDQEVEMLVVVEEGQVWMSNVFMQGTGNDTNVAVDAQRSVHVEGVICRAVPPVLPMLRPFTECCPSLFDREHIRRNITSFVHIL